MTASVEPRVATGAEIFDQPPADPVALAAAWLRQARTDGVGDPGALALATVSRQGEVSNRMVQALDITAAGVIFTSHTGSRKGRDLAETGRACGVLYWRESGLQLIVTGLAEQLPDAESNALWTARPPATYPMSVASRQSAPLEDEQELRAAAERLAGAPSVLQRPAAWAGYVLRLREVEFWRASQDRLHRRLRYSLGDNGWSWLRLQP